MPCLEKRKRGACPPSTPIPSPIRQGMSELWDFIPSLRGEKYEG